MKNRKLLAILTVCAMICCLFATAPVNAAGSVLEANGKWSPSNDKGKGSWTAPTVAGYDGHAHATADYVIGTNDAYDMNVTTVTLNSLVFPDGQWASLCYSPDGKTPVLFSSDVAAGKLCFLLQWSGNDLSVTLWGASGSVSTPKADTYEFQFVISKNADGTLNYGFRVNNNYTFGDWVKTFCENAGFGATYVSLGGIAGVDANVRIGEEKGFVAAGKNALDLGQAARVSARDGYQPIYGASTEKVQAAVGSSTKYDFTENALYLADLWCGFYPPGNAHGQDGGHGAFLRFAQNRIAYGSSVSGTDSTDGLLCFNFKYATDHMELAIHKDGQQPVIASVPFADVYQFRFDTEAKALCINGYFVKDGAITNFINSNYINDSFISITGYGGLWTNAKVDTAAPEEWIVDKWAGNGIGQSLDVSGDVLTSVKDSTAVATGEKKNLTETTLNLAHLNGEKLAQVDVLMTIGYGATGHIANYRGVDVAAGKLTFDFYILKDDAGNVTGLRPHMGGGNQLGAVIPAADTYKFNLVKIGDTYYLVVNGIKYSNDAITSFCNTYTDAYISICSYVNTLTYTQKTLDNRDAFDAGWVGLSNTTVSTPQNMPANYDGEYVRADASNSAVSIRSYDLLKEGITVEYPSASSLVVLSFGSIRLAGLNANGADYLSLGLERASNGYNVYTGWGNAGLNGWYYLTNKTVPFADGYTIYAVHNADGYALYINDTLIPIDAVNNNAFTAFCEAGTVSKCYLGVSTNHSWTECGVRVAKPAWTAVKDAVCSLVPGNENAANVYLPDGASVRSKNAAAVRNSSIVLNNLVFGNTIPTADADPNTYNASATVIFAKNDLIKTADVASEESISFVLRAVEGGELISVSVISYYGGWEYLGTVPVADTYKIGLAYSVSAGKYALKVNNTVLIDNVNNVDEISDFCAADGDDIYALFAAFKTTVSAVVGVDARDFAYGDVNQDFERDILDAVLAARAVAGETLDDATFADADDNGALNGDDVSAIQQIIVNDDLNGFAFAG